MNKRSMHDSHLPNSRISLPLSIYICEPGNAHLMVTGADQQTKLGVQVSVRLAYRALVVHRLVSMAYEFRELKEETTTYRVFSRSPRRIFNTSAENRRGCALNLRRAGASSVCIG